MEHKKVNVPAYLMKKIADGDDKAFEELYYLTYKPLFSYLLSLTKNREDAADLMQETYIKVRSACHLYRDNNPMAWILKIAKNQFLSSIRKNKNAAFTSLDDCLNEVSESDDTIGIVEDRIFLQALLKAIPSDELEIITMYITLGMKHREIAEQLDLPLGTVLSKYNRALKKLRKIGQEANNGQ